MTAPVADPSTRDDESEPPTGSTSAPAAGPISGPPADDQPQADGQPPAGDQPQAARRAARGLARVWSGTWLPLTLIAGFVVGIVLSVLLLSSPPKSNLYLDPADGSPSGAKALAAILTQRGFHVTKVYDVANALAATGSARSGVPAATLVITSPDLLTAAQRRQLASADADLVLVEPGAGSLRTLAPAIRVAGQAPALGGAIDPSCGLAAARMAGSADAGGITYRIPSYATGCYPVGGNPSVVRYSASGRTITILGNGLALSDGLLARRGNAALALNVLSAAGTIVWLTPEPTIATVPPSPSQAGRHAPPLVPAAAWLVVLQLTVALLLAAAWRMRRFGPLISERLPVVVRASETVEGHARLYQARRSRDRASAALRDAMLGRVKPALGLPPDAPAQAVIDGLAGRSGLGQAQVTAICYGPAPASDAELVRLANDLDELEREVRSP